MTDASNEKPEPFELNSDDVAARKRADLKRLFPDVFKEDKIDLDQLRRAMGDWVDEGTERFGLNWPGKAACMKVIQAPATGALRPDRDESVNFDESENVFIEGDNLDALKLLQETYPAKVKMIYIDPPYNTGNDFIYNDELVLETEVYLNKTNQKDKEGNRLVVNNEYHGRFHSEWLSMMFSRLKISRNLLSEDGCIFISIDEREAANVRKILDEIFGEQNLLGEFMVVKAEGGGLAKNMIKGHDYLFAFSKNINIFKPLLKPKDIRGKIITKAGEEFWIEEDWLRKEFGKYGTCYYDEIVKYLGKQKKAEIDRGIEEGKYTLIEKKDGKIVGRYRKISEDGSKFYSVLKHLNKNGVDDLKSIGLEKFFNFPKPVSLLKEIILGCTFFKEDKNSLILDFFAGSSTTAHAVMELNAEDGGKRKYIMVQLPELCDEGTEAFNAGYKTISDISKERIRRVSTKIKRDKTDIASVVDFGFRVLKIDASNMADVYYAPEAVRQADLVAHADNIKSDRTPEDLLFQVLVDWGVDLSLPISHETVFKKKVFFVDGNAIAACFDPKVSEELVKELAKRKPLRAVFRDSSYYSDSAKINVEQIFKLLSPETEVKTL